MSRQHGSHDGFRNYDTVEMSHNQVRRLALASGNDKWHQPPCAFALHISGHVDSELLQRVFNILARRHSALWTFFPPSLPTGTAARISTEEIVWPLRVIDDMTAGDPGLLLSYLNEPFNPEVWPLFRALLIRRGTEDWVLGVAVDHLNFDGTSIDFFCRDMSMIWHLLSNNVDGEIFPSTPTPYEKFVSWEKRWLSDMTPGAFDYWAPQWIAGGLTPGIPVPQNSSPGNRDKHGEIWRRPLPLTKIDSVAKNLGKGHFSRFMLVAAAIFHVLQRDFHESDLALVYPFANRTMLEANGGIGYYSNRLILRAKLSPLMTFQDVAITVRDNVMQGLEYSSMPFGLIAQKLFSDDWTHRPTTGYLLLNVQQTGSAYSIPKGSATLIDLEDASEFADYSGLTVNLLINDADGKSELVCAYGSRFFSANLVDSFMTAVMHTLTNDVGAIEAMPRH